MAKPQYGPKQKVKGGVLKRAKRRAKAQDREGLLKGGVTGREARSLRPGAGAQFDSNGSKPRGDALSPRRRNVGGGVAKRAKARQEQIGPVGGVNPKDGYTRGEAKKVRAAWQTEQRYNPLTPRNGRQLVREANALTNVQYAPLEAELGRERQYEAGRGAVMGNWFTGYQQEVAAAAQRQQQTEQNLQAASLAATTAAAQQQGAQAAATGQADQSLAARGGTSPDEGLAAVAQQAQLGRQQMGNNFATSLAAQGSANTQHMNNLSVAAGQQRNEAMAEVQARQAKVDALARELTREKGNYKTAKLGELKDTERTYDLNRKAFRLDVAQEAGDQRADRNREKQNAKNAKEARRQNSRMWRKWKAEYGADRADEMFDRMDSDRKYRLDVKKEGRQQAADNWDRRHGGKDGTPRSGKYKGYTTSERDDFDKAERIIGGLSAKPRKTEKGQRIGGGKWIVENQDTMIDALVAKGVPVRIAKRAVKRYVRGRKTINREAGRRGGSQFNTTS